MTAISIIVPVYNVYNYLSRCLESLVHQTFTGDYEIICVNDGSTDNSGSILESFASQYDNIKIITQENKGLSEARNEGMKFAAGKYTLFVDSDDFIAENALELLYNYAEEHNSDVVIFDMHKITGYLEIKQTTKWQNIIDKYGENCFNIHTAEPFVYRFVPVAAWNKLYLTSLIKDLKFIKGITCEDVPYWTLVYSKAQRVSYFPKALYFYIIDRQGAITLTNTKRVFDVIKAFADTEKTLKECGCYEKLKYIHWAHFASNLSFNLRTIDRSLRKEFVDKIKSLEIDIDYDEFLKQNFYPFENEDMKIIKIVQQYDFDMLEKIFYNTHFWI
ncbi:glycosyltransferase [bacterium]|nr:glycosyltransferase [bacterium]